MTTSVDPLRLAEAVLFAAEEPLDEATLQARLPDGTDLSQVLADLAARYAGAGVNLVKVGGRWTFRTAADLAPYLEVEKTVSRRLSRAAVEALATLAYHQPVTRAEIEEIRGVALSRGTLDILLETGWIKPGRRRRTPGRPVTWLTTPAFLEHFGLESIDDLPGMEDLKATGLLARQVPMGPEVGGGDAADELAEPAEDDEDGSEGPGGDPFDDALMDDGEESEGDATPLTSVRER
ncbi:MAG: SMC-Scp complex subunit ScpB [Alphaproteobacteria bacterium]